MPTSAWYLHISRSDCKHCDSKHRFITEEGEVGCMGPECWWADWSERREVVIETESPFISNAPLDLLGQLVLIDVCYCFSGGKPTSTDEP